MPFHVSLLFGCKWRGGKVWFEIISLKAISSVFSGPTKHFPVVIVDHILKDVLTNYLQEERYEPEFCKQMTKTISEVYLWFPKVLTMTRIFAKSTTPYFLMKTVTLQ